jgi:hypothetical protein
VDPQVGRVGWVRRMKDEKETSESSQVRDLVVVTAKRLDSDETVEAAHEVPPASAGAIRSQLAAAVSSLYPEAEFRSYADGAATYLAPKLLIVAVYRPGEKADAPVEEDEDTQQQLFAA